MATTGISEFTFGYAFLYEQTVRNWGGLSAAPVLPSLYEEASVGWDAHLPTVGADYYFQFKIPDYLSRGNAAYILGGLYDGPYFRISLHRRNGNQQHYRLKALADECPNTFYVAPEFREREEFNRLFMRQKVTDQSRLIPLSQCRQIADGNQHYITFQKGNPNWIEHSENRVHNHSVLGMEIGEHFRRSAMRRVDHEFAREIYLKMRRIVQGVQQIEIVKGQEIDLSEGYSQDLRDDLLSYNPDSGSTVEVLQRITELAAFFGTTMVIVGME